MTKDDEDRSLIRAAMEYRSGENSVGSVYMGSLAKAVLYAKLGVQLFDSAAFETALATASRQQLDELLDACGSTIRYMQANPRKKCPCCGQIMPA